MLVGLEATGADFDSAACGEFGPLQIRVLAYHSGWGELGGAGAVTVTPGDLGSLIA